MATNHSSPIYMTKIWKKILNLTTKTDEDINRDNDVIL